MESTLPTIHRLHLKSAATTLSPSTFCLKRRGKLGVGYYVPGLDATDDVSYYRTIAEPHYKQRENGKYYNGWKRSANAMERIREHDLVWTRDDAGEFYLGCVTGGWRYNGEGAHRAADICSYRECSWLPVGTADRVPGQVVNSLIRGTAIRRVRDDNNTVAWYSANLWNELAAKSNDFYRFPLPEKPESDSIWELISHEDCEDVVGLYLQVNLGYAVIPGTCKASTAGYEYVLTHRDTGAKAVVQVKQGSSTKLTTSHYAQFARYGEVFLFNSQGLYENEEATERITCLALTDINAFVNDHYRVLPRRVQAWVDYMND